MRATAYLLQHLISSACAVLLLTCATAQETVSSAANVGTARFTEEMDIYRDAPKPDTIRLNHLQMLGSHNSYHRRGLLPHHQYERAPLVAQLSNYGIRALEFDLHLDEASGNFQVFHASVDRRTHCQTLRDCVQVLSTWANDNPGHHPVFVQLELKNGEIYTSETIRRLESEVTRSLRPEQLLRPDDVQGAFSTLKTALSSEGWPALDETRGRFVFFIDNRTDFQERYTHGRRHLRGRLMFADGNVHDPFVAITVLNHPRRDRAAIAKALSLGLIVRTRADSSLLPPAAQRDRQRTAIASGAQLITTDYGDIDDKRRFRIDPNSAVRCNPKTANLACNADAVRLPTPH